MTTRPDPGRRTRLDADDRREQIVAAAQGLFARQQYESVSTSDIATAAGTTRTNIHYHFNTKRDLFLEIVERFARIPLAVDPPTEDATTETVVAHVLGRWLDAVETNAEVFTTMLQAASSQDPQVSGVLAASMRAWEGRLTGLLGLDPGNKAHRAVIRSFQGMVTAATSEWLERGTLSKTEVHVLLTDTLVALGRASRQTF